MRIIIRKFTNITLLVPVLLIALTNPASSATKLVFTEQTTSFDAIDKGDVGPSVGDILVYEADLLDPTTGIKQGFKNGNCETISQKPNGDLIATCKETITLPNGKIYAQGEINTTDHTQYKTEKLDIISGNGAYQGAKGQEKITSTLR